jgi:phosphohistidine swiveling domain-containing protein
MGNVLIPANVEGEEIEYLGGKGKHLLELSRHGYLVPAWFALSSQIFDRLCSHDRYRHRIRMVLQRIDFRDPLSVGQAAGRLQSLILTAATEEVKWHEILEAYHSYFSADEHLAVRSSAAAEDSVRHSFAGQLDTSLFVRGSEGLVKAIKGCWASVFSSRALMYQHLHGLDAAHAHVAVIVQRMVPARVSGVMFTADPVAGRDDTLVITATLGIGVGIVSGAVEGDTHRVNKRTKAVTEAIGSKERMVALNEERGEGTLESDVAPEQRDLPSLSPHEVEELSQIGLRIEQHYGRPQDIEWAIHGDRVYVLQTRPITALGRVARPQSIVWDNSNIIESYPGITLPLTFSFAREAYSVVYQQTAELVGVPKEAITANYETFRNMIGLIRGRVYYNLNSWYQGLSLVPGFRYNKAFMEGMMGVRESLDWEERSWRPRRRRKYFVELPRLALLGFRMLYHILAAGRHVKTFQRLVDSVCREYETKQLRRLEVPELVDCYYDLQRRLLWNWKAPIVNDFLTMLFHGVLRKLSARHKLDESATLQNDLLCGEGGMLSTEPAKAVMRMAATAREEPELSSLFEDASDWELLEQLLDGSEHPGFATQLRDYLNRYGHRCIHELKLEEPSLKDDPAPLFAAIRNYLRRKDLNIEAMETREQEIREQAEEQVRQRLRSWLAPLPAPRYLLFRWVLGRARRHIKDRENMRFARGRVFGLARELFNAIGEKLHHAGHLDDPHDIFYLEVEEIVGFVRGTTTSANLRGLVALRKREFQFYEKGEPPADRFETTGMVWHDNDFLGKGTPVGDDNSLVLRGHGCCSGVVMGITKVVSSPCDESLLKGEILVARETDPGWVSLFPLASGLLIERGSVLSHSAIVAREIGIPTIVGIRRLTQKIRSGQYVEMDGAKGTVTIVPDFEDHGSRHDH